MARTKTHSQRIDLPDGRSVYIRTYDDGGIRFQIKGGEPYVLEDAYLRRGRQGGAVVGLIPRHALQGSQITSGRV
jgi:hypothetical protein